MEIPDRVRDDPCEGRNDPGWYRNPLPSSPRKSRGLHSEAQLRRNATLRIPWRRDDLQTLIRTIYPDTVIPDLIRDLHTLVLTSVGINGTEPLERKEMLSRAQHDVTRRVVRINARRSRALFRLKPRTLHIFSPRQRYTSFRPDKSASGLHSE